MLEASCLQIRPSCQALGSNRLGWIYTEPNRLGRVIKDRVSQDVIFEGRIVIGQIVLKRIVKNRVVLGQIKQSVYTKQNCRGPTRQNQAFRILNAEKNISRKAVHVVILGVTIAHVRWCIDYEKICNETTYRYEFGKNILMNKSPFQKMMQGVPKRGTRRPKQYMERVVPVSND